MKVLFVHAIGAKGGASRSLYELVSKFPEGQVEPHFILVKGTSIKYFKEISPNVIETIGLSKFDNTEYSKYQGFRWLILLREVFYIPFTVCALVRARIKWKTFDIIHLNEITILIPGLLAKALFPGAKLVVHVRSVQSRNFSSRRTKAIGALLKRKADLIICIDRTVAKSIENQENVHVVNNSFQKNDVAASLDAYREMFFPYRNYLKVGYVGNLLRSKGILEVVEAARLLAEKNADVVFFVAGGMARKGNTAINWTLDVLKINQNVNKEMINQIKVHALESRFVFLGHIDDLDCFYSNIDIICFPGYLDAPGRPILEGAFYGKPSIACISSPTSDTFVDYETGIAIPPKNPQGLCQAILHFKENPKSLKEMSVAALRLAEKNFNPQKNALKVVRLYKMILEK